MRELQLTFYDVISVLFPGVLLVLICGAMFPAHTGLLQWIPAGGIDLTEATIALIICYMIGQAVNIVSKFIEDTPGLKQLLIFTFTKPDPNQLEIFYKKGIKVCLNKDVACMIKQTLTRHYPDIDFEKIDDLSEFLLQFVEPTDMATLTKRDVFVATAAMMRNTTLVALGFTVTFFVQMFQTTATGYTGQYFAASLLAFFIFRYGFQKYKGLSERILFSAFLRACKATTQTSHGEEHR